MPDLAKLVDDLSALTVFQAAQLSKMLEEKWGVSAAAPVAVAALSGGAAAPAAEAVAEKTEFDVILAAIGEKKINVIKEVRAITSLGLKEAKDLVGCDCRNKVGLSRSLSHRSGWPVASGRYARGLRPRGASCRARRVLACRDKSARRGLAQESLIGLTRVRKSPRPIGSRIGAAFFEECVWLYPLRAKSASARASGASPRSRPCRT